MNREQAKVIGAMTDEQVKAVGGLVGRDYVRDKELIASYGNGEDIEFCNHKRGEAWQVGGHNYFGLDARLRIVTPKIVFNGVEIDAPIDLTKNHNPKEMVWAVRNSRQGFEPLECFRSSLMDYSLAWVTKEACQLYCDTHNKMMMT